MRSVYTGTVKWFNNKKGLVVWIRNNPLDTDLLFPIPIPMLLRMVGHLYLLLWSVFVHQTAIKSTGFRFLKEGEKVMRCMICWFSRWNLISPMVWRERWRRMFALLVVCPLTVSWFNSFTFILCTDFLLVWEQTTHEKSMVQKWWSKRITDNASSQAAEEETKEMLLRKKR